MIALHVLVISLIKKNSYLSLFFIIIITQHAHLLSMNSTQYQASRHEVSGLPSAINEEENVAISYADVPTTEIADTSLEPEHNFHEDDFKEQGKIITGFKIQGACDDTHRFNIMLSYSSMAALSDLPSCTLKNNEMFITCRESINVILGQTLIHETLRNSSQDVKELLNSCRPSVITYKDENKLSPLMYAGIIGNSEITEILLQAAEVNPVIYKKILTDRGPFKKTALMLAAGGGKANVVKRILKEVSSSKELTEELLLAHDKHGLTALACAAGSSKDTDETVKIILDAAQKIPGLIEKLCTKKSDNNYTVLLLAAKNGKLAVAQLLIEYAKNNAVLLREMLLAQLTSGYTAEMLAHEIGYKILHGNYIALGDMLSKALIALEY